MKNWAENVQWNPSAVAFPHSENEIQQHLITFEYQNLAQGYYFIELQYKNQIVVKRLMIK